MQCYGTGAFPSFTFAHNQQLLDRIGEINTARIVVLSAYDNQSAGHTICHLSATAPTQSDCITALDELLGQELAG